jgi:spore coat protein YsxE
VNQTTHPTGNTLAEVLEQYGWEPAYVQYAGNVWRVSLPDGEFALKKSQAPREKLWLLHQILEQVRTDGYPHLLPWARNKQGEPVVQVREERWYATPWKNIWENERKVPATEMVKALAHLHSLAEPVVEKFPELPLPIDSGVIGEWKNKQGKLAEYADKVEQREFPSPFDQSFRALREPLDRMFHFAIRGMERFVETEDGVPPRYTLCHRRLHESNVVYDDDQFYFIDFDHAQVESPVRDLALAIKRFADMDGEGEPPFALIEAYESVYSLKPKEKKLLALYLSYPERIMKMLKQYYDMPQVSFTEAQAVKRLETEMMRWDQVQELVKQLWPNRQKTEEKQVKTAAGQARTGKRRAKAKRKP